jgi:hypothetical protein
MRRDEFLLSALCFTFLVDYTSNAESALQLITTSHLLRYVVRDSSCPLLGFRRETMTRYVRIR